MTAIRLDFTSRQLLAVYSTVALDLLNQGDPYSPLYTVLGSLTPVWPLEPAHVPVTIEADWPAEAIEAVAEALGRGVLMNVSYRGFAAGAGSDDWDYVTVKDVGEDLEDALRIVKEQRAGSLTPARPRSGQ